MKKRASAITIFSATFIPLQRAMLKISFKLPIQPALHLPGAIPFKDMINPMIKKSTSSDYNMGFSNSSDTGQDYGTNKQNSKNKGKNKKLGFKSYSNPFSSSVSRSKSGDKDTQPVTVDGIQCWIDKMVASAAYALIERYIELICL